MKKLLAIILFHQVLICFAKTSEKILEVDPSVELISEDEETSLRSPDEKVINSDYMYLYKTNGPAGNYLNYRTVYGLRYSPTKKPLKKYSNIVFHEPEPAFNSSTTNEEINSEHDEGVESLESETSSSSQSEMSLEQVPFKNHTEVNVEPIVDESRKHIMRPNNRVEHALDFLADRLKKLLYHSTIRDRPEAKLSPHLTSLGRFLNLFSLIRFENIPCASPQKPLRQLSGTCYNEVECSSLGGVAVGRCASGFGVCCVCEFSLLIFTVSRATIDKKNFFPCFS